MESAAKSEQADPDEERLREYRVSLEAIEARKKAVADLAKQIDPGKKTNGKQSLRIALARLRENPLDAPSLDAILRCAPREAKDDHFTKIQLAQLYGRFGESFSAEIQQALRSQAEAYAKYMGGGTENHIGMKRVAAMVFGEAYPEMKTAYGISGSDLAREAIAWMSRYGHAVFASSMAEYLSTIYLGSHSEIWLTAKEHAGTDAARLMSRAMLDWIWSDLAVNAHLGQVLPPLPRDKTMITNGPQMSYPNTHIQWLSWLYWGDERSRPGVEPLPPYLSAFKPGMDVDDVFKGFALGLQTAVVPAVSQEVPNEIIRNIGAKRVALPYRLRQSRVNNAVIVEASQNDLEHLPLRDKEYRYSLRSVYVAREYGLGAGYFKEDLDAENRMHLMWNGIVYKSQDALNRIHANHPYWYTAVEQQDAGDRLGLDNWLGKSPFEQCMHWDNALLFLYDIPETDPYVGDANDAKTGKWTPERTEKCLRAACVYVPRSIDEKQETPWGWLLRENDVYIAIRPFGAERTEWRQCATAVQAGYESLTIHGSLMGLAIEVGDKDEYGSMEAFAAKAAQAKLDISKLASAREASYLSSRGTAMRLQFVPGGGYPRAWVNGAPLDFDNWPVCESPYVSSRDGVLDVNDGRKGFSIDWSGDFPQYEYYDIVNGNREVAVREWLDNGLLKTERTE
ncbi:MAG: hypothetical protein BWZ10_01582 [candidate division BRC1 bacterium ADurb.BinA364]|nr:MAG: hypothetical protein BWZ10_01582 [candidate division BRC1 bacterium ADurb.BinA364]